MPFDPSLPVNHTKIVAAELRAQFTGLFDLIQTIPVGPAGPPGTSVSGAVVDGVTTGPAGGAATAGASFDGANVRFTFGLPRGDVGETGAPGAPGPQGIQGATGAGGAAVHELRGGWGDDARPRALRQAQGLRQPTFDGHRP